MKKCVLPPFFHLKRPLEQGKLDFTLVFTMGKKRVGEFFQAPSLPKKPSRQFPPPPPMHLQGPKVQKMLALSFSLLALEVWYL